MFLLLGSSESVEIVRVFQNVVGPVVLEVGTIGPRSLGPLTSTPGIESGVMAK
jgi:hypothetical protein